MVTPAVKTDFLIALELGNPVSFQAAQQFQIGQATIPTIENDQFRLKSAFLGLFDHVLEVIILSQSILSLVVKSIITRQATFASAIHTNEIKLMPSATA